MITWKQFALIMAMIIALFGTALAVGDRMSAQCAAEPADNDPKVLVQSSVPNNTRVVARIRSRIDDTDDIYVRVGLKGTAIAWPKTADPIVLWANGNEVTVHGNSWVPQEVLDDFLYRTKNVNRNPIDIIMGVMAMIHEYQVDHPKPEPPPPPPAVQGPPVPPPTPEPPFDWSAHMIYVYIASGLAVLFLVWLMLHIRLVRRRRNWDVVRQRAEQQADWSYDQYGIKTSKDL